jgi:hypothetical protein
MGQSRIPIEFLILAFYYGIGLFLPYQSCYFYGIESLYLIKYYGKNQFVSILFDLAFEIC